MYRLTAEHDSGGIVANYGEFATLGDCQVKIAEIDGPDPMDDPQWPEGCDAVATDTDTGRQYCFECDAWFEMGSSS